MQRRDFLKNIGGLGSFIVLDSILAQSLWIPSALGGTVPLASLQSMLNPEQALILFNPQEARFQETLVSFNKRTTVSPSVRVLCKTSEAVAGCILWAKQNNVPLAMRNGGHSYEGFSQTTGIVIDVRLMNTIETSESGDMAVVGGGAVLGRVYEAVSKKGRAIPAGSCPTVGVSGHTTGGGFGLLARPFGLACDSLLSVEIVTAQGLLMTASETVNPDLFWALRGAGGGNFGIITKLNFKTHAVKNVTTFLSGWSTDKATATRLLKAWQAWAPVAPNGITTLFKFSKSKDNLFTVRLVGQTVNSVLALTTELNSHIYSIKKPDSFTPKTQPFLQAVQQFGADKAFPQSLTYPSVYMKGKSDYVKTIIPDAGYGPLFDNLPPGIAVIFDSYGGQVRARKDTDTAFAHRENTIASIQYYTQWDNPSDTPAKLNAINTYYSSLRPYMSGSAYVNYCDLDIKNYAQAYWGQNLARLVSIKNAYDPENIFKHAQSVPVKL